jgi:antitoxin HicB
MSKRHTVSDGKMVLTLEEAEEGGYIVTSPLNPELITQAESIEEAFANARDAAKALRRWRTRLMRQLSASKEPGSDYPKWIAGSYGTADQIIERRRRSDRDAHQPARRLGSDR